MLISLWSFEKILISGIRVQEIIFHQDGSHALMYQFQGRLTNLTVKNTYIIQETFRHSVTSTTQLTLESVALCVACWNWNYGRVQIVLTSMQNVDNGIPVRSQLDCKESGVLNTIRDIVISPSSIISHEVWIKPIMFIVT